MTFDLFEYFAFFGEKELPDGCVLQKLGYSAAMVAKM